jgi:hypothetical protein
MVIVNACSAVGYALCSSLITLFPKYHLHLRLLDKSSTGLEGKKNDRMMLTLAYSCVSLVSHVFDQHLQILSHLPLIARCADGAH